MRTTHTVPLTAEEKRERELSRLIQEQARELECEAEELASDPRHPSQFRMEMELEAEHLLVLPSTVADELTRARQAFGHRPVPDPQPNYRAWPEMLRPTGRELKYREQLVKEAKAELTEEQLARLNTELTTEEERSLPDVVPLAEMSRKALHARLTDLKTEVVALMSSAEADERRAERLRRERLGDDEVLVRKPRGFRRRPSFPPFVAEQGEEWIEASEMIHEKPRLFKDIEEAHDQTRRRLESLGECLLAYGFHELKRIEKALLDFKRLNQEQRDAISFQLHDLRQEDLREEFDQYLRHAPFHTTPQLSEPPRATRERKRPSFRTEDLAGTFVPVSAPALKPTGFPHDRLHAFLVKVRQSIGKELLAIAREYFDLQKETLPALEAELADLQEEIREKPRDMHAHLRPERVPEIVTILRHPEPARA